jgi:hypothetical protein
MRLDRWELFRRRIELPHKEKERTVLHLEETRETRRRIFSRQYESYERSQPESLQPPALVLWMPVRRPHPSFTSYGPTLPETRSKGSRCPRKGLVINFTS